MTSPEKNPKTEALEREHIKEFTSYEDLNVTLEKLARKIEAELGSNLIGIYLQGSFGLGDFTPASDADVLVVIREDIDKESIHRFQELHKSLHKELPEPWGQKIELAYAPVEMLRRKTGRIDPPDYPRNDSWTDPAMNTPAKTYPFWYLDNGADTLVRSEHDNSNVVRWVTREKGITLVGPDPKTLIEPVTPGDLAGELLETFKEINDKWSTLEAINTAANQSFFTTLCCRVMHTLHTGTVTSKKAATEWALENLDEEYKDVIQRAWDNWQNARDTLSKPADPEDTEITIKLIKETYKLAEEKVER